MLKTEEIKMNIGVSADSLAAKVKALQAKNENDTTNNSTEISKTDRKSRDEIQQKKAHQASIQARDVLDQINNILNNNEFFSYPMQPADTKGAPFTNGDLASLASTLKDPQSNAQGHQVPSFANAFVAVLLEILESMMSSTENVLDLQEKGFQGNLAALQAATSMSETTIKMAGQTRTQAISAASLSMTSSMIGFVNGLFGMAQVYKSASTPRNMQTELDHLAKQGDMDKRVQQEFSQLKEQMKSQQTSTGKLMDLIDENLGQTQGKCKEKLDDQHSMIKEQIAKDKEAVLQKIENAEQRILLCRDDPKAVSKVVSELIGSLKKDHAAMFEEMQKATHVREFTEVQDTKKFDLKGLSYDKAKEFIEAGLVKKPENWSDTPPASGTGSFDLVLVSTIGKREIEITTHRGDVQTAIEYHQLRVSEDGKNIEHVAWIPEYSRKDGIRYELKVELQATVDKEDLEIFRKKENFSILKDQKCAADILKIQQGWQNKGKGSAEKDQISIALLELRKSRSKAENDLISYEQKIKNLGLDIDKLEKKRIPLSSEIEKFKQELKEQENKLVEVTAEKHKLQQQMSSDPESIPSNAELSVSIGQEEKQISDSILLKKQQISEKQSEIDVITGEIRKLNQEKSGLLQNQADKQTELASIESRIEASNTKLEEIKSKFFAEKMAQQAHTTLESYHKASAQMEVHDEFHKLFEISQFPGADDGSFQRIYRIATKATSEAEVSYAQTQILTQTIAPSMVTTLSSISTMQSQQASAQSQELSTQASAIQQQNDASVKIMQQVASDFLSTANTCLEKLLEMIISTLSVAARALDTRG